MSKVVLYYDIISPYSYLALNLLSRYNKVWKNMDLVLKPVSIANIMKTTGNSPPMMVSQKTSYIIKDLNRLSKYYQVPLNIPSNFINLALKIGTKNAMQFITAIDFFSNGEFTEKISFAMFRRIFLNDPSKDITTSESFLEAGNEAGIKHDILLESINKAPSQGIKEKFHFNTNEAVDFGAFGTPSFVVHLDSGPQLLFGSDRIELLANLIGEKYLGPLPKANF